MSRPFGSRRVKRGHLTERQYAVSSYKGGWDKREAILNEIRHYERTMPGYAASYWRAMNELLRTKP